MFGVEAVVLQVVLISKLVMVEMVVVAAVDAQVLLFLELLLVKVVQEDWE